MKSSGDIKNLGGRPATGQGTPVLVRLQPGPLAAIDEFIGSLPDPKPSRPEAIRRIVDYWFVTQAHAAPTDLSEQIQTLKDKVAAIPESAGPSPAAALNTMKKAIAENEIVNLKNLRKRQQREGIPGMGLLKGCDDPEGAN